MEQVKKVLSGEIVQVNPSGISTTLLGLPFTTETGTKAMFIEPIGPPSAPFIIKWIWNFLIISLGTGCLLILVAAMFVVRPIKKLTQATRHIAGGDFNFKLNIKQKGELGTLALKQADITDDERSRYLDIIIAEAYRMSKMSDSLLKLSLLESQPIRMRCVHLPESIPVFQHKLVWMSNSR